MSESEILAVLATAFEHCPEEIADVLQLLKRAQDEVNDLSSAQISGPDAIPDTVDAAFDEFHEALGNLAAEVARHAQPARAVDSRRVRHGVVDYALITVVGDLDEASAPQVRDAVKDARRGQCSRIAIDLTAAKVRGRHGMSPLVNAQFTCRAAGGELLLVAPSAMVSRVLGQIAGEPLRSFLTADQLDRELAAGGVR